MAAMSAPALSWQDLKPYLGKLAPDQPVGRLLGLFSASHMAYELDRASHADIDEPSLAAMTVAAIRRLQNDADGFFLHVEAGRIDHAHHATNPLRALEDVLALDAAVAQALRMTSVEDTLIIVTADHSHVMSMAGYPTRGNPILGKVAGNDMQGQPLGQPKLAADGYPYTTLGYINGIGFAQLPGLRTADAIYGLADNDAAACRAAALTSAMSTPRMKVSMRRRWCRWARKPTAARMWPSTPAARARHCLTASSSSMSFTT